MIESILPFIIECERLKSVLRRTYPIGTDRRENSAEHSWSLALLAMTLAPTVSPPLDQLRVLRMLLVHDIVEIDAGDTFAYDARPDREEKEQAAAERLFGLLPADLSLEFMGLWREFEDLATPESRFANALDRMLPLIQNHANGGRSWIEHGITYQQAFTRNRGIEDAPGELWEFVRNLLSDAAARGLLREGPPGD